jgi:hypothetical protein
MLPDGVDVYGGVTVSLNAAAEAGEPGFTSVVARFFDGATPALVQLELDTELDECELLVPVVPFCPESCAPAVCTADDVCTPYPEPLAVGSLSVSGLGDTLAIEPKTSMQVYQGPSLPSPPCEAGSTITASASGLMLEAECIEPLVLTGPDPIPVTSGQVVEVRWEATQASTTSRIRIRLDISHHGGKKGEINCEVADTGSFDIPEPLVTKLIGLGLAGFPDISVTRVTSGSDATHPDVTLLVSSNVMRPVDTGVVSCQDAEQCPGQDCLDTHVCG